VLFLDCNGTEVRPFDPINQPTDCANGAGPTPRLSFFDPGVKVPQSLKLSLGVDHGLPGGIVGTGEVLYTRSLHQWDYSDANLRGPIGAAQGEGRRPLYGGFSATGTPTPLRRDSTLGSVVRVSDRSGDRSVAASVQLRKRVTDHAEVSVLYARTWAWDHMSLNNPQAPANLANTPLDGTLENRQLRTSSFEIPHRVELAATVRLPYQVQLSLLYAGASGTPYTYSIFGDANADGIGSGFLNNDIVYVPRDRADIALDGDNAADVGTPEQQDSVYALLDGFIEAKPCLREQRGRILERNSCRNPWFGTLNARLTKVLPTLAGQSLELTADVYNILNIVNQRWGQSRVTTLDPQVQLLQFVGYDATAGRGIYRLLELPRDQLQDLASRWQMELSVRYVF